MLLCHVMLVIILWSLGVLTIYSHLAFLHFVVTRRFYHPPTKLREGNVFSCVCPSFCSQTGVPCEHYPWCIGHHCTRPLLNNRPWTHPSQSCSFDDPKSNIWWWPPKHLWFQSGWYISYWNVHGGVMMSLPVMDSTPSGQHPLDKTPC